METQQDQRLRRLAFLEEIVFTNWDQVLEWYHLRKWVLDNDLLNEYKSQNYFARRQEVTQNGYAPKNPSSIFSRFLKFLSRR